MKTMNTVLVGCIVFACVASAFNAFAVNQLQNPGFENDSLTDWQTFGDGWSLTQRDVMTDFSAAENVITPVSTDEYRGILQEIPILPGQMYVFSSFVKAYSLDNAEIFLELQFLDAEGKIVKQHQSSRVKKDQIFKKISVGPVEAPMGSERASVRGIIYKDNKRPRPTNDTIVFDDMVFELVE